MVRASETLPTAIAGLFCLCAAFLLSSACASTDQGAPQQTDAQDTSQGETAPDAEPEQLVEISLGISDDPECRATMLVASSTDPGRPSDLITFERLDALETTLNAHIQDIAPQELGDAVRTQSFVYGGQPCLLINGRPEGDRSEELREYAVLFTLDDATQPIEIPQPYVSFSALGGGVFLASDVAASVSAFSGDLADIGELSEWRTSEGPFPSHRGGHSQAHTVANLGGQQVLFVAVQEGPNAIYRLVDGALADITEETGLVPELEHDFNQKLSFFYNVQRLEDGTIIVAEGANLSFPSRLGAATPNDSESGFDIHWFTVGDDMPLPLECDMVPLPFSFENVWADGLYRDGVPVFVPLGGAARTVSNPMAAVNRVVRSGAGPVPVSIFPDNPGIEAYASRGDSLYRSPALGLPSMYGFESRANLRDYPEFVGIEGAPDSEPVASVFPEFWGADSIYVTQGSDTLELLVITSGFEFPHIGDMARVFRTLYPTEIPPEPTRIVGLGSVYAPFHRWNDGLFQASDPQALGLDDDVLNRATVSFVPTRDGDLFAFFGSFDGRIEAYEVRVAGTRYLAIEMAGLEAGAEVEIVADTGAQVSLTPLQGVQGGGGTQTVGHLFMDEATTAISVRVDGVELGTVPLPHGSHPLLATVSGDETGHDVVVAGQFAD